MVSTVTVLLIVAGLSLVSHAAPTSTIRDTEAKTATFKSPCDEGFVPYPVLESGSLSEGLSYDCVEFNSAYEDALNYLLDNLPPFDKPNADTLGFGSYDGVAGINTNLSLSVKNKYSWAAQLSKEKFYEYVLPYSDLNEPRTNWRPLFLPIVEGILDGVDGDINDYNTAEVVELINSKLWNGAFGTNITFKGDQTPLIFDPMSILAYGYASCTGVSIFFVNALRSVGISSRVAGTPAWNNVVENGNHNWVEVWTNSGWQFIEAAPAGSGETLDNPCDKWFCNPEKFANGTEVFAARFGQSSSTRYVMSWDLTNMDIPGEDMTRQYQLACNAC